MNLYVLSWLLIFLTPGGCPIYSIDLSTLEVHNRDFQNELTLQSMLNSELREYRNGLNERLHDNPRGFSVPRPHPAPDQDASAPEKQKWEHGVEMQCTQGSKDGDFLGTNLFYGPKKHCFSTEDIALMSARKDFEMLVPKSFPQQGLLNDGTVNMLIRYFNTVNQIVKRMGDDESRRLLQKAFYDSMGGYLRYYLVPSAQISFYAGRVNKSTVLRLVQLYQQCLTALNTNGNGWRSPKRDLLLELKGIKIDPIKLSQSTSSEKDAASCAQLDTSQSPDLNQGQTFVSTPSLYPSDEIGYLGDIYVPFHHKHVYNLQSPSSASILVKFFETVTNCHRFQGISQDQFNRKMLTWIRDNIQMHYMDEKFYPGLGGVLKIKATIAAMKGQSDEEESAQETEAECRSQGAVSADSFAADTPKIGRAASYWSRIGKGPEHQKRRLRNRARQDTTTRIRNVEEREQCENDDTLIWCIATFLTVLLLVILLIICCCMRKGRKKPVDAEAVECIKQPECLAIPKKEERLLKVEKKPSDSPKSIHQDQKQKQKQRSYYSGSSQYAGGVTDRNGPITTSSSLACQFSRRVVPLRRDSSDEPPKKDNERRPRQKGGTNTTDFPSFTSTPASVPRSPTTPPPRDTESSYTPNIERFSTSLDSPQDKDKTYGNNVKPPTRKERAPRQSKEEIVDKKSSSKRSTPAETRNPSRLRIGAIDESADDPIFVQKQSRKKITLTKDEPTDAQQPVQKPSRKRITIEEEETLWSGSEPSLSQSSRDSGSWETTFS